ncbi:hypothetical protein BH09BAC6_BH09BAC6_25200 [soil metagenome]|jgi:sensor c-di-GMP phosphodiesterase-like protein
MDNLNELKAIWHTAKTEELPPSAEMLRRVKTFRNQKLRHKVMSIIAGSASFCLMVVLWATHPGMLPATKMAMIFTLAAAVVMVTTNVRSIKRFIQLKDCSNKEFIQFLEKTRRNQLYFYKYTQVTGLALSCAAILCYLYESARLNAVIAIVIDALCLAAILFLWFYIRPRNFKRQSAKLDALMRELEKIANQLK